jgi:hypothetical protein
VHPNRLDEVVQQFNTSAQYDKVQQAAAVLIKAFVDTNITNIGLVNGEDNQGFVALTKQVDYPGDKVILGDSVALFAGTAESDDASSLLPDQVSIDPGERTITLQDANFNLNYNSTNGANPVYVEVGDGDVTSISGVVAEVAGAQSIAMNPNRNVSSGSMKSIEDVLTSLHHTVGPWDSDLSEYISAVGGSFDTNDKESIFPEDDLLEISDQDIINVQKFCSPILV